MPKTLTTKQLTKAGLFAKQYTTGQLEMQIYRTGFLNALGKICYWVPTFLFLVIGCLMAYDALFLGASAEKVGAFLRLGVLCAVIDAVAYYVFRVGPKRDLRILEEALRLRTAAERTGAALEAARAERSPAP